MRNAVYTLKEVVGILCRSKDPDEAAKIMRQVRHWTVSDLLPPSGRKHTGTGTSREYTAHEIRMAAILLELARYKVPVTVLEGFDEMVGNYSDGPEWRVAVEGKRPIFLQFAFPDDRSYWLIHDGSPKHDFLASPRPVQSGFPDAASAIIVNLTKVFRGLPK